MSTMTTVTITPKRSTQRRPGRPKVLSATEPPLKKRRYVPGGPGGGGRYVDDDGNETPVGGTGPGGYAYSGTRRSAGRHATGSPSATRSPPLATFRPRPRRNESATQPRYSSAAAAASAMSQNEGYKPREERSWEEFHPDLDIEAEFLVFSAEDVDNASRDSNPVTPYRGLALHNNRSLAENGAFSHLDDALRAQQYTPGQEPSQERDLSTSGALTLSPAKRRVGRPPKQSMLSGLGSPPAPRIVPLPTHNPKERLNLPKPNYRRVETFLPFEEAEDVGVNFVDKSLANVGYQETDRFYRAVETYIRGGEGSIEEELDLTQISRPGDDGGSNNAVVGRVEYDMDEQDLRWLEGINAERKAEQVDAIKPAFFEITMTQIEKEWHALEKRIPKPTPKAPQTHRPRSGSAAAVNGEPAAGEEQDTKCAICDDGDCENTNAIVFCDGCDLAVHQECYGVPFIPEGQWLCRKCQLIGRNTPTCIFCPNIDGAFKQSNTLRWSHLLCAIWIPEVSLGNHTFMEPVMDVEKVPKQRWKLTCYICQQKMGACVQCGNKNCYQAFHVTCARRAHLYLKMKNPTGGMADKGALKAYCDKHVPSEWRKEHSVERATIDAKEYYRRTMKGRRWADSQSSALALPGPQQPGYTDGTEEAEPEETAAAIGTNKRRRQAMQKKIWRLPSGAPIVPQAVYDKVETALQRFAIRKRKDFVAEACKYWTLKREARRGASLLKRLQLQMETFTSMELTRRNFAGMGAAGRPRLQRRVEFSEALEKEMEKVVMESELVQEKEALKMEDAMILRHLVDTIYFPIVPLLVPALEKAISIDENNKHYFKEGLEAIRAKLNQRAYIFVQPFVIDIANVFRERIGFGHDTDGPVKLTPDQKDIKSRANRIIGRIKPTLMDAARKEAELGLKEDVDEDARQLAIIFENCLKVETGSAQHSVLDQEEHDEDVDTQHVPNNGPAAVSQDAEGDVGMVDNLDPNTQLHGIAQAGESTATTAAEALHGVADTAVIRLQIGPGQTIPISNTAGMNESIPALSNSGSTNPSTTHPDPLTPPRLEKNLLDPLANGGTVWYLERFEPYGTTVHDETWSGREVLRGMSEELSELDDEAVNGLVDAEMQDVPVENSTVKGADTLKVIPAPRKRAPSRRKRIR